MVYYYMGCVRGAIVLVRECLCLHTNALSGVVYYNLERYEYLAEEEHVYRYAWNFAIETIWFVE